MIPEISVLTLLLLPLIGDALNTVVKVVEII
jgi:hypothetical protein